MTRFKLDEMQADAILELKLYRLARARDPASSRRSSRRSARRPSASRASSRATTKRWGVVTRRARASSQSEYGDKRRTKIGGAAEEVEFDAEAFIVDEDAHVVVTRDGWVKRVREVKDPAPTRAARGRRGDGACSPGSTKAQPGASSRTAAPRYVIALQRHPRVHRLRRSGAEAFKFDDGERMVGGAVARPARCWRPEKLLGGRRGRASACASRSRRTPRVVHARGPPLRAGRARATRSSASRRATTSDLRRGASTRDGQRAGLQGRRDQRARGPGQGRHA